MKFLLRNMVRPLYYYIKKPNEQAFAKLYDKWGSYERYKLVEDLTFLKYTFDVPDTASFLSQFKELFVDEIYHFQCENKSPLIIDCGANIGSSCLYFKSLYPTAKIIAFEADKRIATILEKNLKNNNIDDIDVVHRAVWIDDNGIEFSTDGADGGSIYSKETTQKVKSIRLKNYLEEEPSIDLLKIDIEGAEYEVLKDCQDSLGSVERIFVEYHSWNGSPQKLSEILEIFEKNGFRYYIESLTHRKHPLDNYGAEENMDLQLNIFGVRH